MSYLLFNKETKKWEQIEKLPDVKSILNIDRKTAILYEILRVLVDNKSIMTLNDLIKKVSESTIFSKRLFTLVFSDYKIHNMFTSTEGQFESVIKLTNKGKSTVFFYLVNTVVTESPFSMEFIKIPAGQFITGHKYLPDSPMRKIYLDDYEISKYPVTNREYSEFTGRPTDKPDHPVVNVSWYEAMEYCKWLSEKTNSTITLPTEAQFVKAARGGIWLDGVKSKKIRNPLPRRKYPWGNDEPTVELANYDSKGMTPVSMYYLGASPYGCQGMAGNVWQWCLDWYDSRYYNTLPRKNPVNEAKGEFKTTLGGSWQINTALDGAWRYIAASMAIGNRGNDAPSGCRLNLGFRCVRLKG